VLDIYYPKYFAELISKGGEVARKEMFQAVTRILREHDFGEEGYFETHDDLQRYVNEANHQVLSALFEEGGRAAKRVFKNYLLTIWLARKQ